MLRRKITGVPRDLVNDLAHDMGEQRIKIRVVGTSRYFDSLTISVKRQHATAVYLWIADALAERSK